MDPIDELRAALEMRPSLASYDEAWLMWQREIGMARDRYAPSTATPATDKHGRIVTVAGDWHIPWHDPEMVADLIARESARTDLLVIPGDFSDAYALSRFLLYEWMPHRDEWAQVQALLDVLAASFRRILISIGNHDSRLEKQLISRLTPDMVEAVRWMTGGLLCPLTMLAKRYANVDIAQHPLPGGHAANWFAVVGDAWIGHPEAFSVIPGGALRKVENALAHKAEEWGLGEARLVVVAHTHQRADIPWRSGCRLIEPGCLCRTQGYQTTPRMTATTQRHGYLTFWQDDTGRTDFNSVRLFDYDEWARLNPDGNTGRVSVGNT